MNAKPKTSRTKIIIGLTFFVMVIFAIRLFNIQIIDHDKYRLQSENSQTTKYTIQPKRGQIYIRDRNNFAPLVLNEPIYTAFADPVEIDKEDESKVAEMIRKIAPDKVNEESLNLLSSDKLRYVVIAKQLTRKEAEQVKDADFYGVGVQIGTRRSYPEGGLAGQVLGFVNADGEGQYGIEQYLDIDLRGTPGLMKSAISSQNIPLTIGVNDVRIPAVDGANVVLTLDRNIQSQAETILKNGLERVGAENGSMLVMDPNTGAILAMTNYPTYNPAEYFKVQDASAYTNNIVSNPFEPGSVAKVMTMASAIDSGSVWRESVFSNTGCVQVADANICNADRTVDNRTVSMTTVLQYSLNTGVVWALSQMGNGNINNQAKEKLYDYFSNHYRLNRPTGIEQAGEIAGNMYKPTDVQGGPVNYANMTFGQGFSTTVLNMAAGFSAVVNGGTYYKPHLVYGDLDTSGQVRLHEPEVVNESVVSAETSRIIREMMKQARYDNGGNVLDRGYFVGAKSGTAQVYDEKTGKYSTERMVGTYLGFGADVSGTPKYVIMVRVDDSRAGGYAGTTAAGPIFTEMSNWIINYEGITK